MNPAVDFYIEAQPVAVQALLRATRRLMLSLDERIREEFLYGVPCYYYHDFFAYLIRVPKKDSIHLVLVEGAGLADPFGLLIALDRKTVRRLPIGTPADVEREGVRELLYEALVADAQRHAAKKARRR